MPTRIMYVCSLCEDSYPEGCGRWKHTDLRVLPDDRWICQECFEDAPMWRYLPHPPVANPDDDLPDQPHWNDLPVPPEYVPAAKAA